MFIKNKKSNFIILKGTSNSMKVKIFDHQDLSFAEKQINEFLQEEHVKQLIDIKFGTRFKDNVEQHTFVVIYQENPNAGKEDPQMYE